MPRRRELIQPHPGDTRYVRRDANGRFTDDQVNVHRSLSKDVRQHTTKPNTGGQGDRGDRQPARRGR